MFEEGCDERRSNSSLWQWSRKRLTRAKTHKRFSVEQYENVFFSDETHLLVQGHKVDFAQLFEQPQHLAEEMFWGWMYYNGLEPLSLCRRNNEFRHMHLLIHYQKRFSTHFANASRMQEDFPRSHKSEKSSFFFLKTK